MRGDLPAYPGDTSRHAARADPATALKGAITVLPGPSGPDAFSFPIGLRRIRSGSTASVVVDFSRLIGCSSFSLRPICSTRRLLSTPPHGDAVGAVFGREQFNSTGRTFTCVITSFTGVHDSSSATRPTRRVDCNLDAMAGFAAARDCVKTFPRIPSWIW